MADSDSRQLSLDLAGKKAQVDFACQNSEPRPGIQNVRFFVSQQQRELRVEIQNRLLQTGVFRPSERKAE